jgi:purine-nucleoside/S-methyl-5'-thioadenosine phosphorylase / adenosine deaminase
MPPAATKKRMIDKSAGRAGEWKPRRAAGLQILESPALVKFDWLVHGFSARPGGASELPGATESAKSKPERVLNLGFTDWDSRARVAENRTKFFRAIGAENMRIAAVRQIHSDLAHRVDADIVEASSASGRDALQGDALFTRDPGILLIVQTADCVPILLADTKQRGIAAIHSGWRGTLKRIAEKTLGRMTMEFGTRPEDVIAAIGPAIGRCCYEVGSDVAREFDAQFRDARAWFDGPFDALASGESDPNWLPWLTMKPPGHAPPSLRVHLDLLAANRAILTEAGIPSRQISVAKLCTACRPELLFSYRREKTTGRLLAAIGIK